MQKIRVVEIFDSIEGEGRLIGYPVSFIRLEGCNLRCSWCDTTYSYDTENYKLISIEEILDTIKDFSNKKVCITGGEPLINEGFDPLFEALIKENYYVILETNGTVYREIIGKLYPEHSEDIYVVCSPKPDSNYMVHRDLKPYISEMKLVVDEFLTENIVSAFVDFPITLQPEGNKQKYFEKALKIQKSLVKKGIEVRIIPQIHKFFKVD